MPATAYLKDFAVRAVAATDYFYFGSTANGHADSKALISTLFTSPTFITPVLGAATGTSLALSGALTAATVNKVIITAPAAGSTLTIANGKTLTASNTLALAGTDGTTMTFPTTSATIARTDAANTFTGAQTFSDAIAGAAITATSLAVAGAVTGTSMVSSGSVRSTSASAGMGYSTGAGGTVTQATNRSTGVTLNAVTGNVITNNTSLAAAGIASFTVTNSAVAATDTIILTCKGGQTANTSFPYVTAVGAGSFEISLYNRNAATADTGAMTINFAVIKAVTS